MKAISADGLRDLQVAVELHASLPCSLVSSVSISRPGGVSVKSPDLLGALPGSSWAVGLQCWRGAVITIAGWESHPLFFL